MKINLNKIGKVSYDFVYKPEDYGYDQVQKYYCNKKEIAGYILRNVETNELFFIEYYGLDSWRDDCLEDGQDELAVYRAEKVEFGGHTVYNLSAEPRYVYLSYDDEYDDNEDDDFIEDDESKIF